jgi:hypothetical protein
MMNDKEDGTVTSRNFLHELSEMQCVMAEELNVHIVQRGVELAIALGQHLQTDRFNNTPLILMRNTWKH